MLETFFAFQCRGFEFNPWSPVFVCQPCGGKGHLHLWLGGFKGVVALGAAVGQAVGLVVCITLVAMAAVAVVGVRLNPWLMSP